MVTADTAARRALSDIRFHWNTSTPSIKTEYGTKSQGRAGLVVPFAGAPQSGSPLFDGRFPVTCLQSTLLNVYSWTLLGTASVTPDWFVPLSLSLF